MQSTAFFETKVALTPKDLNYLDSRTIENICSTAHQPWSINFITWSNQSIECSIGESSSG
jgi:hypothetical protein